LKMFWRACGAARVSVAGAGSVPPAEAPHLFAVKDSQTTARQHLANVATAHVSG
jgi:hypothetical protein